MTPEHQQAERGAFAKWWASELRYHKYPVMDEDAARYVWMAARRAGERADGERADVVPPGMVLVPIEPTKAMIDAGTMHTMRADEEEPYRARGEAIAAWSDMVAASQDSAKGGKPALSEERIEAARYRWLRDVGDATWRPFGIRAGYSAQEADAAIDAAIAASGDK